MSAPGGSDDEAAFVAEVLRINLRFVVEVVEAHDVCPFAAQARARGAVARQVVNAAAEAEAAVAARALVEALAADATVEVALVIFPRLGLDADGFERFAAPLRSHARAFVGALFHPAARYGRERPAQLVGLFRRAPDPTLQLVRYSVLEAVRGVAPGGKFLFDGSARAWAELERRQARPGLSERIAGDNFVRVTGAAGAEAALLGQYADIAADRARAYARFTGFANAGFANAGFANAGFAKDRDGG